MLPSRHWVEPQPVDIPPEFLKALSGPPLLAEMLFRRGIQKVGEIQAFLDPDYYTPSPAAELPDLEKAADRIEAAIHNNEVIGVWGDFDVDGQTATTVLVDGLKKLNAKVTHYIPVRQRESHGVHVDSLAEFIDRGVDLVLTCDTGISALEAVEYCNQRDIEIIITDHHTLPPELPPAYAVVNPQRLAGDHPLASLCGVGAAFKLVEELYGRVGRTEELETYLDLVALGTVADVAVLTGDNRYLVQRGLKRMQTNPRLSIQTILDTAEVEPGNLTEGHIGFVLAPRLNALGRLDDSNPVVNFLSTTDQQKAALFASRLEGLNNRRKQLCDDVFHAAQSQLDNDHTLLDDPVIVLEHPQWPAGVIGIVANRIADLYGRPALLIAAPPGQIGRGSARSIDGINITEAIGSQQDLLEGFGGHPMAAGFAIPPENIPRFRQGLGRSIRAILQDKPLVRDLNLDAFLSLEDINLELVEQLNRLAPFGAGNPPLVFASRDLRLQSHSQLGRTKEHRLLFIEDQAGHTQRILWWRSAGLPLPEGRFDMAYTLQASNFRGEARVQVEYLDVRLQEDSLPPEAALPDIQISDHRHALNPEEILASLPDQDRIIWHEGEKTNASGGVGRRDLTAADVLIIWNLPPGRAVLQDALMRVMPQKIILFGSNPALDNPRSFLAQLAGMLRHAINQRNGWIEIPHLAEATAQPEAVIQCGLDWLRGNGHIHIADRDADRIRVAENGSPDSTLKAEADSSLINLLKETSAFREYYLRADPIWILKAALPDPPAQKPRRK
jgi:single-stranded-DNA-specific exonuclease